MATDKEAHQLMIDILYDLLDTVDPLEGNAQTRFILSVDRLQVEATFEGAKKVVTATAPNPVEAIVKAGRMLGYDELYPKWEEE